ncbi:hypothetical protein B5U98_25910 [Bosea sp. Tri-39]|nr:hypothetical protein BLM15_14520 [Bosea sp. Tri-49]RXT17510.1 hypothetical protein B5U98_25910 [Bosea sp. Tri-39]RXT40882.1 hypothetical protein B5U99_03780 [Bosea sp. Tri-54]
MARFLLVWPSSGQTRASLPVKDQAPGRAEDGKDCRLGLSLGMGFTCSCGVAGSGQSAGRRTTGQMRLAAFAVKSKIHKDSECPRAHDRAGEAAHWLASRQLLS